MTGLLAIPPLTALVALLCWRRPALQAWIGLAGTVALAVAAVALLLAVGRDGVQVLHVGGWIAPQGIALVADPLAAALCVVAALVGIA
ncbi:MAG: Mrp-type sodium/proton antiporter system subunit, partial [Planctomycetota bacterium]